MSFSNIFDSSYLEDEYVENNIQYKIKIDMSAIFKAKLISYVRQGLKIEKLIVPQTVSNMFKNTPVSDNGKYILYTSVPEYLIDDNVSPNDLVRSFKKWITRFLYHNKTECEYINLKENHQLAVEIRNKIRKDEHWTEEQGDLYVNAYYLSWNLYNTLGNEKMVALSNQITELSDKINNMSNEEFDELMEQYEKLLQDNPELLEGLSGLLGEC